MKYSIPLLFRETPMVYLSIALVSGILFAFVFPFLYVALFILGLGLITLFLVRSDTGFTIILLLSVWAAGWAYHVYESEKIRQKAHLVSNFHDQEVTGQGIFLSQGTTRKGIKLTLRNVSLIIDQRRFESPLCYFLYTQDSFSAQPGDTIFFKGQFQEFRPVRNPGQFDYRLFYHRKNIYGRIFQNKDSPVYIRSVPGWNWQRSIDTARKTVRDIFQRYTDGNVAGLLSALILGDKSDVDPELRTAFVATGVIHVLAVSGLHVGYVLLILMILTKLFRIPWGWDRVAIVMGLLGFVLLTGGKPSVVRASIMAGLYVLAPVVNRPVKGWNIVATAAFIILLWNPVVIVDLGFLLSFMAVISIIYFYGLFERILPEKLKVSRINSKAVKFIWGLFLVSVAAQIGTLPITAFYFGKVPIISLIANVVIVPLVGILVALGFSILLLGWLPWLGAGFGQSAWVVTQGIHHSANVFSTVPFASYPVQGIGWIHIIQYGLFVLFLFIVFQQPHRGKAFLVAALIFNLGIWSWAIAKRGLDVIFLDVGQGDAAIVRFEDGKNMLIDAGLRHRRKDMGKEVVLPVARYLGISKFNWVVMTHPHSDHIGGLVTLVKEIPIDTVWDTYADYGSWTYTHLLEEFDERDIYYAQPYRGEVYRVDAQTIIQIFAPDSSWLKTVRNVNNLSIVLRLLYGKTSILFTGDLERNGDALLIPYGNTLDSDVLKVAHHGSITSTTQPFLELVQPEVAVISVGYKNKFNHPSRMVLDRLEQSGAKVYRTDQVGAVWLHSNGKDFREVLWR